MIWPDNGNKVVFLRAIIACLSLLWSDDENPDGHRRVERCASSLLSLALKLTV